MMKRRKSTRNRHNSSGRCKNNTLDLVDRISALPDSILGVILSYLPTKNAVATTILSKRWKFAWMTVHNLDFCLEDRRYELSDDEDIKFVQFVNRVLLLGDGGLLNKFRLVWRPRFIPSQVSIWINTAIKRNVRDLFVSIWRFSKVLDLPEAFNYSEPFNNFEALESLELNGSISVSAAIVVCLPRLKSLKLVLVHFRSEEAFEKLISGCPMLNYLHLHFDMDEIETYLFHFRCRISSTSLSRLEVLVGHYSDHRYTSSLELEASSLKYLKLEGFIPKVLVQGTLSSLVEADFRIQYSKDKFSEDTCNSVVEAVRAFDCAKTLTLSMDAMWALSNATICLSTKFKRLTKLEAGAISCYCSSLQDFIQSSDSLEVLTVYQDCGNLNACDHDHSKWTDPVEVPRCLSNNLKTVAFKGYGGYDDEHEMIGYMLKHGGALELMQVTCQVRKRKEVYLELLKGICRFPRKSPACKVEFIE